MDIDLLAKMVSDLILDNDEVSLPGLGTFVAEGVAASFSDRGFTINPPYRKLSFRQREGSDSLLISFYASSNSIPEEQAKRILEEFLSELKEILKSKKSVILPGLGKLRATKENNFFFVPDEDMNISPDTFGLESISLKSHEEQPDEKEISRAVASLKEIITPSEVPAESPSEAETETPSAPKKAPLLKIFLVILALAAVFFIALAVLGRVCPEIVDSLLYSPEELELIYGK